MNRRLLTASLIAGLGGFLFGFDTAVISGAEQAIKDVFNLDGFWHGLTTAIALIGTIFGALLAGKPGEIYGRRNSLIIIAVFYTVSAIGSGLAGSWYSFLFYRFLGGLGVGASSVLGPMYLSEIAPARLRGRLVALFQFNIVLGILTAYFSNYIINEVITQDAWRWMMGVETLPAVLFFLLLFTIPESPRWLVKRSRNEEVRSVLFQLGNEHPDKELQEIKQSLVAEKAGKTETLFTRKYSFPIILAVLLATFNQFSGIIAMNYAPRIFEMTGLAKDLALLQVVGVGLTNLFFTVLAMFIIDRFGRKTLLVLGSMGMIVFLGLTSSAFYQESFTGYSIFIYLIGFMACFAFSQGAVIWVFLAEVFPNAVRAKGQALGSLTHWIWAAVLTWVFPVVAEMNKGAATAFAFFGIVMVCQLVFVIKVVPETKGKSLEEIEAIVLRKGRARLSAKRI